MNPAYISAISALCGSAIGAVAPLAISWLIQRHQDDTRREAQENTRRERIFVGIHRFSVQGVRGCFAADVDSRPFESHSALRDNGKIAPFCVRANGGSGGEGHDMIVQTYYAPKFDLKTRPAIDQNLDILRDFTERYRAELR